MNVYASNLDNSENMKTKLPVGKKKNQTQTLWKTKYNPYVGGIVLRLFCKYI